ncbi:MAG: T9SS type A sorting domain-containing protein [Cytophagaceae bacterium]
MESANFKTRFRQKRRYALFMLLLMVLFSAKLHAEVSILAPGLTVYPCQVYPTAYYNLGNIVLTENNNGDFAVGTNVTFRLEVPENFEFRPGFGAVAHTAGNNITASAINVTATHITITLTVGATNRSDQLTISGIQVRGLVGPSSGVITRAGGDPGGGTAVIAGAVVGGRTYGTLISSTFPPANAGQDKLTCSASTTMEASPLFDPNITGTWTLISGSGTIANPGNPASGITSLGLGDNVFRWTITNSAGCSSFSEVLVTRMESGLGCTVAENQFSAVTAISPTYDDQDIDCPPPSDPSDITIFTLANPGPFNVGEKVLVIQMQGAVVNTAAAAIETGGANDNVFGSITDYNGAGNYEYAIIATKAGNQVTFSQNLVNQYNVNGSVQLVTVPQFGNYTLAGALQGTPWNPATRTGGVLVFEVLGTMTLNGGTISMNGRGFIGGGNTPGPGAPMTGTALNTGVQACGMGRYSSATGIPSTARRGEGIAADPNHGFGRGALANGGGSGAGHNSGAGGGSNVCAGGRGGHEFSPCYTTGATPYFQGYNAIYNGGPAAGQISRMFGIGGYPLAATNNRIFMGGGGGAGNGDDTHATAGGNGGGIIIITAQTIAGTGGIISSNGQVGYRNGVAPYTGTADATGGGGAGGSIVLDVETYSITSLALSARGGKGGDNYQDATCHGNGGGGGGGLVRSKGLSPNVTVTALGGDESRVAPHQTTGNCRNTPYGSTAGTNCTSAAQALAFAVPQKGCCSPADLGPDQTLCGVGSITLENGTLSDDNKIFRWYRNGVLIAGETGPTLEVTSPGFYGVQVDSVVSGFNFCTVADNMNITNQFPTPFLGPDQQLCDPAFLNLFPVNLGSFPAGTEYEWRKDGLTLVGEDTPYLNNTRDAGTYTLIASAPGGCGPTSGSITLTTVMPITVDNCIPTAGTMNLSVSDGNGGPYRWYADQAGGSSLHEGDNFTTPHLTETTTYWVEDQGWFNTTIGPSLTSHGYTGIGTRGNNSTDMHLFFDATQTFRLHGLTLTLMNYNCTGNQTVTINVRNSGGGLVGSRSVTVNCQPNGVAVSEYTYAITFATPIEIPAGTGYRLDPVGTTRDIRWWSGGGDAFPWRYDPPAIITHTQNGRPGYFDWRVSYERPCSRVPVIAEIGGSCELPVEYVYFKGQALGADVKLEWATAQEINNDKFLVQRSEDGQLFTTIGEVKGNGNSNAINSYTFVDPAVPAGILYYRLAQKDYDGTKALSNVISVSSSETINAFVYPNPFEDSFNLSVSAVDGQQFTVKVYSVTGCLFIEQNVISNEVVSLGSGLPKGVFIVEIIGDDHRKTIKLLKNK